MDRDKLFDIGMKKRNGEFPDKTWDQLNIEYRYPFKNGDSWRNFTRKRLAKNFIDKVATKPSLNEHDLKFIESEKQKVKLRDQRTGYNKIIRDVARFEELQDTIIQEVSKLKPYKQTHIPSININSTNDLKIDLNDIHFGIEINNYWNKYTPEIAKKRLEKYLQNIFSIQKIHNSECCYVCANGDLISGNIHLSIQVANKENVVGQVMGVSELISWFLSELSNRFNMVYFAEVPGNHSRTTNKNDALKDERLDDLVPWYVKSRLQNFNNIKVLDNEIDNTVSLINIRGLNYLNVHGDLDSLDNANSVLKLIEMIPVKVYAICGGHLHHNKTNWIQGYKTTMSGSLMGVDDYCISKRLYGKPQQLVSVCTENGILTSYDVILD